MFPCARCSACCRQIGLSELGREMALPNGICKFLNQDTNLCTKYESRPIFCNVDKYYDLYLINVLSREEYYRQNLESCKQLRRKLGLPEMGDRSEK